VGDSEESSGSAWRGVRRTPLRGRPEEAPPRLGTGAGRPAVRRGSSEAEAAGPRSPRPSRLRSGNPPRRASPTRQPATEAPAPQARRRSRPAEGAPRIALPQLGESVTEGTVTRWLKQVGDSVEVDEPLLEVSTDKVDTEIPSPMAGTFAGDSRPTRTRPSRWAAVLAVVGDGHGGGGLRYSDVTGTTRKAEASGAAARCPESEPARPLNPEPAAEVGSRSNSRARSRRRSRHADATSSPQPQTQRQAAPADSAQPTASGGVGTPPAPPAATPPAMSPRWSQARRPARGRPGGIAGTGVGGRIRKQDVLAAAEARRALSPRRRQPRRPHPPQQHRPRPQQHWSCEARRRRCPDCGRRSPSGWSSRCRRALS
jgi:2-oxoglutarate dehydrogenase E2 component (dihydrolipoamide succinyltransferase)